jgi:hypothetical protein
MTTLNAIEREIYWNTHVAATTHDPMQRERCNARIAKLNEKLTTLTQAKLERIPAGYRAWNGHIFSQRDADTYNAACDMAARNPSERNISDRHRLFRVIIGDCP